MLKYSDIPITDTDAIASICVYRSGGEEGRVKVYEVLTDMYCAVFGHIGFADDGFNDDALICRDSEDYDYDVEGIRYLVVSIGLTPATSDMAFRKAWEDELRTRLGQVLPKKATIAVQWLTKAS